MDPFGVDDINSGRSAHQPIQGSIRRSSHPIVQPLARCEVHILGVNEAANADRLVRIDECRGGTGDRLSRPT